MEEATLDQNQQPMSVQDWVITLIITAIPIVGIIMLFVWAFGDSANIHKRNWSRAALIISATMTVLFMIFGIVMGTFMGGM